MKISVCAADAIDRVEILKNNVLEEMIVHSGTWENKTYGADETIRVKFAVEFGWGPNPRFYKDMLVRGTALCMWRADCIPSIKHGTVTDRNYMMLQTTAAGSI